MNSYDIAIIGAGPAGSTLARLLDKRFKTIIIDKKSETENSFRKPCGGLLSPDAQKFLAEETLTLPSQVLADPQIFSVRTVDLNSQAERHYPRSYLNMDRHKFDLWLLSLIPEHVNKHLNGVCRSIECSNGIYTVNFTEDGSGKSINAKHIVGADGANSIVRKTFFTEKIKHYTAIQQWFRQPDAKRMYSAIFDSTVTDSYAWTINKDGWFIFGAALPLHKPGENFEKLKNKLTEYGYNFDNPEKTEACLVLRPRSFSDIICGENNVYLVGEAGGFISPSSLEGISWAFKTARALSGAFNQSSSPLKAYISKTRFIRAKLMLKYLKMPFMYNRTMRKLVMKSGVSALKSL